MTDFIGRIPALLKFYAGILLKGLGTDLKSWKFLLWLGVFGAGVESHEDEVGKDEGERVADDEGDDDSGNFEAKLADNDVNQLLPEVKGTNREDENYKTAIIYSR